MCLKDALYLGSVAKSCLLLGGRAPISSLPQKELNLTPLSFPPSLKSVCLDFSCEPNQSSPGDENFVFFL
eukprot:g50091.t1